MPSVQKHGKRWRVQVARKGVRLSRIFDSKTEAQAWGRQQEAGILDGKQRPSALTVGDMLREYGEKVSGTKKGATWELRRIAHFQTLRIAPVRLSSVDATHIAKWRDERLLSVSSGTVLREWTLLAHAFQIAVREWKWLAASPMAGVRRPIEPPPRERIISDDEQARLLHWFGDRYDTATGRVGAALILALETGMRAGELCGLTWDRVDLESRVATLPITKNGSARQVPLSPRAIEVLGKLSDVYGPKPINDPSALKARNSASVLALNVQQLDALWRKGRDKAMVADCHFHDARATAVTRLARKLDILDLARMIGHRDLKSLMAYYRKSAADIAPLL
jgi:integrase